MIKNWVNTQYPVGSRIRSFDPDTGAPATLTVVNHYVLGGFDQRTAGVIAMTNDRRFTRIEASFLDEDGEDRVA